MRKSKSAAVGVSVISAIEGHFDRLVVVKLCYEVEIWVDFSIPRRRWLAAMKQVFPVSRARRLRECHSSRLRGSVSARRVPRVSCELSECCESLQQGSVRHVSRRRFRRHDPRQATDQAVSKRFLGWGRRTLVSFCETLPAAHKPILFERWKNNRNIF